MIESVAFVGNRIKEINLPSSLTSLGDGAFNGNQVEGDAAFIRDLNNSSKLVSYAGKNKNVTIPSNISVLSNYAFMSCGITTVTIPTSVTEIGMAAFSNNKLKTVVIPNSVVTLKQSAFADNRLEEVTLGANVTPTNSQSSAFKKSDTSNPNLTLIHNLTGQSFRWGFMINYSTYGPTDVVLTTGVVPNNYGDVTIVGE